MSDTQLSLLPQTEIQAKKLKCQLKVVSATIPVTGVTLNKSATTIEIGKIETLVATVLPSGATNKSVTWTSNDSTIASVTNGVVSGLKKGTTTVNCKNK